ncbi:hypothetical protein [Pseudomonas sp. NMI795_08]|uniref:hypothetical protein n=1 Tax=Pseudomonas sp. NMI795_08 TaxID=2903144 RepID=UPI001E49DDAD|nr:hypothetical protein [Pseudomonas sp. NMI795_08]MCE1114096.1 hypothetical protein [Pseudomonas sp. NMI795_08]
MAKVTKAARSHHTAPALRSGVPSTPEVAICAAWTIARLEAKAKTDQEQIKSRSRADQEQIKSRSRADQEQIKSRSRADQEQIKSSNIAI